MLSHWHFMLGCISLDVALIAAARAAGRLLSRRRRDFAAEPANADGRDFVYLPPARQLGLFTLDLLFDGFAAMWHYRLRWASPRGRFAVEHQLRLELPALLMMRFDADDAATMPVHSMADLPGSHGALPLYAIY